MPVTVKWFCGCLGAGLAGLLSYSSIQAQVADEPPPPIESLKKIPVPGPDDKLMAMYVRDKKAALQLGKALFWDVKVGSDNKTACASCHFQAGADNRITNQINPGLLAGDRSFQVGAPNHVLKKEDFPFTKYLNPDEATVRMSDANDVVSSQGVHYADFVSPGLRGAADSCTAASDDIGHGGFGFHKDNLNTRRVEPRNTPSVINAVFNFRNFWDGRANNVFNGGDPFGLRNSNAFVYRRIDGVMRQVRVSLPFSSLASQGSGPPLSEFEMSCNSRTFVALGKKVLRLPPLSTQTIAADDSVLGPLAAQRAAGIQTTYLDLVKTAFHPDLWTAPNLVSLTASYRNRYGSMDLIERPDKPGKSDSASQAELNFSLFMSLALQMYQATLVSDETPYDRFAEGDSSALNEQQVRGLAIFRSQGKCVNCHGGAEFTNASVRNVFNERLEQMVIGNGAVAVYDNGFYNIGVRPTSDDIGVGGQDKWGNPLSETRMAQQGKTHLLGNSFNPSKNPTVGPDTRVAVDGAFKTPGLRNVELTGPYFHNGGQATLRQVVDFYNRGGDFARENHENLDADIRPLGLDEQQKEDLVAFLLSLTDDRVRFKRAPFDHPSLCIPNGHATDAGGKLIAGTNKMQAADASNVCLPSVGKNGASHPLTPFLNANPFDK